MLKWVFALCAMGAALTVGFLTTQTNLRKYSELHLDHGPSCLSTPGDIGGAFPSDVAAVEKAWGEPIPDALAQIGGVDWYGWAQVCRSFGMWEGAYRDALYRYEGRFEFVTPAGEPARFNPVGKYYLSHYDRQNGLLLYRIEPEEPPVSYYFMRLAEPERLERRELEG